MRVVYMAGRNPGELPIVLGIDSAHLIYSRINQGQMLVTFADSHSALSVLDVDGMKVSSARSPVEWGRFTPQSFLGHHMRQELAPFLLVSVSGILFEISNVQPWPLAEFGRKSKF